MQAESKFLIEHWIQQEAKIDKTALLVTSIHYCGLWLLSWYFYLVTNCSVCLISVSGIAEIIDFLQEKFPLGHFVNHFEIGYI